MRVRKGEDEAQLDYLAGLTAHLKFVEPEVECVTIPRGENREENYALVAETLKASLRVPVRMISFGPTERDKMTK